MGRDFKVSALFSPCRYLISVLSIFPPKKKPELCDQALAVSKKSD
jgi:hypothetical protein